MALTPGSRLGVYEITAPVGEGGMGQVYRATDTTLGRQVAIKILPDAFALDPDRLARFEREAKTLASLNHPHIAAIYGFEKSGGLHALVMELVEGEDLSQRIARGSIPIDEALTIAKQIADALEAAHEQGIIHRDLKPANVKVRADGTVKVLDFGLAKAAEPTGSMSSSVSMSPTITTPAMTQAGMILGTAAYMSPEQARGKIVDKRADIWAFGAVLFEMLAGQRAFAGDDLSITLAAIVMKDPAWPALPAATPSGVQQLLRRCLMRDPRQRMRDMGDVRLALESANDSAPAPGQQTGPLVWALALMTAASMVFAVFALWNRPTAVQKMAARLTIALPPDQEITTYPAISRDGRIVAYVTQHATDESQLYLRDLNSFEPRAVAGATGARQPFFSPDGKWVAFFAHGQLQKAQVTGGASIRLAEAAVPFGGTWNEDNTIIYTAALGSGLLRIPASGGTPESLTRPDGAAKGYAHVFPQALPGGRRVYFTIWGQTQGGAVLSLDTDRWEMVLPETAWSAGIFEPAGGGSTGRLLVGDPAAGIRAAPFDAAHPARTSVDTSVLTDVYYDVENEVRGWLAVSNTGTAVYVTGNPAKRSLVWVDRDGKIESLGKDQDVYAEVNLSPDETKVAVRRGGELWVHDLPRGTRSRLTSGNTFLPQWSRDGTRIIFASNRSGDWDIYSQPADGSRPAEALLKRPADQFPVSMLEDGTLPRRLFDRSNFLVSGQLFQSYDVAPDGKRFLMIQRDPGSVPRQLNVILNWSEELNRLVLTK